MAHPSIIMLVCHRIISVRVLQKKSKKRFDSGLILILESIIPLLPITDTGIFNYPVSCFCWPWLKLCYFHTFVGQRKWKSTHFRNIQSRKWPSITNWPWPNYLRHPAANIDEQGSRKKPQAHWYPLVLRWFEIYFAMSYCYTLLQICNMSNVLYHLKISPKGTDSSILIMPRFFLQFYFPNIWKIGNLYSWNFKIDFDP